MDFIRRFTQLKSRVSPKDVCLEQNGHHNSGLWLPHAPRVDEDGRTAGDVPSLDQLCFETGITLCAALAAVLMVQLLLMLG